MENYFRTEMCLGGAKDHVELAPTLPQNQMYAGIIP
jgi:hypothetical protein